MSKVKSVASVDCRGRIIKLNDEVAVACKYYQMDGLHVQVKKVTKIVNHKVYLDDNRNPLRFPDRVCVI